MVSKHLFNMQEARLKKNSPPKTMNRQGKRKQLFEILIFDFSQQIFSPKIFMMLTTTFFFVVVDLAIWRMSRNQFKLVCSTPLKKSCFTPHCTGKG